MIYFLRGMTTTCSLLNLYREKMHLYSTFQVDFKWKILALKTYYSSVLVSTTHFVQRKQKLLLCAFTLSCVQKRDNLSYL